MSRMLSRTEALFARVPRSFVLLILRIALAVPFFRSGLTKWDGFLQLGASQGLIFSNFQLHLFGAEIPYPYPLQVAYLAGVTEIVLPILLILGLLTRFSALGLLVMTGIIQLTMPGGWANFHLPWAAMALALIAYGSGRIALDPFVIDRERAGLEKRASTSPA